MLTIEQYERLNPISHVEYDGRRMTFSTPNRIARARVDTILSKEPCTIEWLTSFQPGEMMIDVGANVGMYTIWAAVTRNTKVIAFEPEAQNYALLNRNILNNNVQDRVRAYCIGLTDRSGLVGLHLANLIVGGSCHSVGEALDFKHEPLKSVYEQGCVAFALDDLVSSGGVPVPDHIKIDVDGFEPKVFAGARTTLQQPTVKSLLIEINLNLADHREIVAELTALGFRLDPDQVRKATRTEGPFKGVAEHVFRR